MSKVRVNTKGKIVTVIISKDMDTETVKKKMIEAGFVFFYSLERNDIVELIFENKSFRGSLKCGLAKLF